MKMLLNIFEMYNYKIKSTYLGLSYARHCPKSKIPHFVLVIGKDASRYNRSCLCSTAV